MKKINGLAIYVAFSIAAVIIYTIIQQYIFIKAPNATEMSTLTTCFFAFFGVEITISGLIKLFKLKGETKHDKRTDLTESDEPEILDGSGSISGISGGIDNGDRVG